jgi:hypothetical protein
MGEDVAAGRSLEGVFPGVAAIQFSTRGQARPMDDTNASARAAAGRAEYDDLTEVIVPVVLGAGIVIIWLLLWSLTNLGGTLSLIWAVLVSCLLAIATDWVRAAMKP